ncbi:Bub2p NDAI_0G04670 [Naumovozyma dairenensis CBS 421]|uniref:Rab-GAP TBC domain-containing protein n=1 Tax=Naumovozyma dairenensis (strain ATCC 10597 / BCRC 20456 / CBS 421 / NBRC 0211 / NRRL Y-12639) TaxID=1071378 RepID=J7RTB1_NAUDC|nr:hypothetical protein NDAI_0G04670 [Naumovozyma dairenensis CBS 421]CCK73452.1 hypothetical protein NDAI_0G04670 [Naumovozyma dairenensis CBS 421]
MTSIERLISEPPLLIEPSLSHLRYLILSDGLPTSNDKKTQRLRSYVWSILSRTSMEGSTQKYLYYLSLGLPNSKITQKILDDTFRTFSTDEKFTAEVKEDVLIRCLSCFAWQTEEYSHQLGEKLRRSGKSNQKVGRGRNDIGPDNDDDEDKQEKEVRIHDDTYIHEISPYLQGMNIILAPLLYACPTEPIAFKLFSTMCYDLFPAYITKNMKGSQNGAKLLDLCLEIIDPKLSGLLHGHLLNAQTYAYSKILTFSSSTKPLDQVIKLWDFMFAYGFHMNILLIIAMFERNRSLIMKSESPLSLILNGLPDIDADEIISLAVGFIAKIPTDIYELLVEHLVNSDIIIP